MKTGIYVEFAGTKTDSKLLVDKVKEVWRNEGKLMKDLKSLDLFFKPEEQKCYYIINGLKQGCVEL